MYEKDFLRGYELRNWNFTPRIYKIIGISALINVLAIFVFAQTNLLTRKGCDSPFVSTVCQVLDTVYLSKVVLGTETDYIDNPDYVKQNLGDADITFIDVSNVGPPLSYPAGYFPLANPEDFTTNEEGEVVRKSDIEIVDTPGFNTPYTPPAPTRVTPPIVRNNPPNLRSTRPNYPKRNKNPIIEGDLPKSPISGDGNDTAENEDTTDNKNPTGKKPEKGETAENKKPEKNPEVNPNSANESKSVADVQINKAPIEDLGEYVNKIIKEDKEFSLQTPFLVEAKGRLKKNGRFDADTFKYIKAESSNEKMIEIVKQSIEAMDAAGYLQYLEKLSGKDLRILLQQDDKNISAVVESELESAQRATSIKSGLALYIALTKKKKSGDGADEGDKDDLQLLNNANVETNGNKIIIKFVIPNPTAQDLIRRKLLEQKQKEKQKEGKTSASKVAEADAETGK